MLLSFALAAALVQQAAAAPAPPPSADYVPQRVFDTRRGAFIDFETMVSMLGRADVVLVGEQHDDPNTHRLEHALLSGLRRRRIAPTVSLEMFERDVQPTIDGYLSGAIAEPQLLKDARAWPRYATDYRALVELAKTEGWPVVAANLPRRFASAIAKTGEAGIGQMSAADRAMLATDLQCPRDAYFERFASAMTEHTPAARDKPSTSASPAASPPPAPAPPADELRAATDRYYWAQCSKDETMAESIARASEARAGKPGPVVHITGAFHSDFGAGTAERTRRRLANKTVTVVTILPVADLDTLAPGGDDLKRADFLVFTVK